MSERFRQDSLSRRDSANFGLESNRRSAHRRRREGGRTILLVTMSAMALVSLAAKALAMARIVGSWNEEVESEKWEVESEDEDEEASKSIIPLEMMSGI